MEESNKSIELEFGSDTQTSLNKVKIDPNVVAATNFT